MELNRYQEGEIILIDKPLDWTSFDVVKKLRYLLKVKKIGHAGTLDPLATGLLVIGTGKFTKKLNEFQGLDKCYTGIIEIGKTTPSYDLETEFDSESSIEHITESQIMEVTRQLTGLISQVPPVFSAIKVDGKRAYKHARKKEDVVIEPRKVMIYDFELTKIELPEIHFHVKVSKGTYIRSLAHDFGQLLGTGAYLKELRRTEVGEFKVSDAPQLDQFVKEHSDEAGR